MAGVVVVLHDAAAAAGAADAADVLVEAEHVSRGLESLGYDPVIVRASLDLESLEARLRSLGPRMAFNLVESLAGRGDLIHVVPALLESLPRLLRVPLGDGVGSAWLTSLLRAGTHESSAPRPGGETVLAKLSELLFVEALRRYIELLPGEQTGWLAGLRDRFVGRALALMHGDPGHDWTVEELAGRVGASRSSLAQRFSDLLGQAPMQYLTRWRLTIAAQRLRDERVNLARLAEDSGYESEAAFNRAFKRALGTTPGAWRKARLHRQDAKAAKDS